MQRVGFCPDEKSRKRVFPTCLSKSWTIDSMQTFERSSAERRGNVEWRTARIADVVVGVVIHPQLFTRVNGLTDLLA